MQHLAEPQLGLVLTFDLQTQARLEQVINRLEEQGHTPFPEGMRVPPHITLATFTFPAGEPDTQSVSSAGALPSEFSAQLASLARRSVPIDISLESLGVFGSVQGVIFLAPVVTRQLQTLHGQVQGLLEYFGATRHPYYLPDHWVPHVTIAVEQPPEVFPVVFRLCQQAQAFSPARAEKLLLVDFPPPRRLLTLPLGERAALESDQATL